MRLSDAIATGRVLVKPLGGAYLRSDGSGCALGMAGLAGGVKADVLMSKETAGGLGILGESWAALATVFPAMHTEVKIPCSCHLSDFGLGNPWLLGGAIAHLFDMHVMPASPMFGGRRTDQWTLDELIDWVRSVEPAEPESISKEEQPDENHVRAVEVHG